MSRNKVAFIHTGAWGDLYVSTAALKEVCVEAAAAKLPVTIIGSAGWLQIIDSRQFPEIESIIVSRNGFTGERFERDGSVWRSVGRVQLLKFFRSIAMSFNLRTESLRFAWAPFLAGVPRRHGSAPAPWGFLFTHLAPWLGKDPVLHERDRLLQVVEAPGRIGELAEKWRAGSGLPKLRPLERDSAERLASAKYKSYWLINPTSSRREKAWPAENFRNLFVELSPLLEAKQIALRILGAPNETDWLREVVPAGLKFEDVVVQPSSIHELIDVVSGSGLLITNTSSAQFLTPGADVVCVTLMGRADPRIWGPLGRRDRVVGGKVDESLNGQMWAQESAAYRSITVGQVLLECKSLLDSGTNSTL